MSLTRYLGGVVLIAALPLLGETPGNPKTRELLRFTLNENAAELAKALGPPGRIDDSAPGYQSWQYEYPADERNDDNSPPAWFVCVRTGNWQILSVTRNFDRPQDVDDLFPAAETTVHHWPAKGPAQFSLRLRRLPGESLLLAMGSAKPGERTTQLILLRRPALKTFMPWLAEQLQ